MGLDAVWRMGHEAGAFTPAPLGPDPPVHARPPPEPLALHHFRLGRRFLQNFLNLIHDIGILPAGRLTKAPQD